MKTSSSQLSNGVSTTFSRDRGEECGHRTDFEADMLPHSREKKTRNARFVRITHFQNKVNSNMSYEI